MLKKLLNLLYNGASLKRYYLEIGAYLLKKGAGYEIGQIIKEKKLEHQQKDVYKVKIIKSLTYDFGSNQIHPTFINRVVKSSDKFIK